jgi:hypothetical protein
MMDTPFHGIGWKPNYSLRKHKKGYKRSYQVAAYTAGPQKVVVP